MGICLGNFIQGVCFCLDSFGYTTHMEDWIGVDWSLII